MLDTVRGTHLCHVCGHPIAWAGNIFGGLILSHGAERAAEVTVTGKAGNELNLGLQIQCDACNAVNRFSAKQTI